MRRQSWAQITREARDVLPRLLHYDEVWTQAALGALLGVSGNYVALVERGEKQPGMQYRLTLTYLLKLAEAGIDPRNL